MATGYIEPESGMYIYGADDPRQPMHDVLNLAQMPLVQQMMIVREGIRSLEDTRPLPGPLPTPTTGNTREASTALMTVGGLVFLTLKLTRTSDFPSAGATLATLPAGFRPVAQMTVNAVSSQGGNATTHVVTIDANGAIRNWTTAAANRAFELQAFWLAAAA